MVAPIRDGEGNRPRLERPTWEEIRAQAAATRLRGDRPGPRVAPKVRLGANPASAEVNRGWVETTPEVAVPQWRKAEAKGWAPPIRVAAKQREATAALRLLRVAGARDKRAVTPVPAARTQNQRRTVTTKDRAAAVYRAGAGL